MIWVNILVPKQSILGWLSPPPSLSHTHTQEESWGRYSPTHIPKERCHWIRALVTYSICPWKGWALFPEKKITLSTLPLCRPTEGGIGLKIVQGAHLWRAEAAQGQRYSASLAWPRPGDPEKTTTAGYQAHTAALVLALLDPPSLPPLPTRGIRSCLNPRDPAPNRGLIGLGSAGGQSGESQKPGKISPSFGLPGCWNGTH